ncbi:hypothetical protein GVN20_05755 [Runella sp. CRIBMP]|uniref:hypothetical protein n=1 Tax=Runella sp. CRIBMP TaxID=2683261 RepID=UPI0014122FED|nr:hypothetical protein [Runella sp. CRIBMP]NBB18855.1 hypothetical protein [Runella sp. CRIBMP]
MKKLLSIALGIFCLCATLTAEAQFRNRNDLKFLNAVTGKDTNTIYTTAVDNADLSLGGIYVDGITVTGTTDRTSGTLAAAVKFQKRLNSSAGWTDIPSATYSVTNAATQSFTIELPAGYYTDIRAVITGTTGLSTTKIWAGPYVIRR